jgi:hypothetical protein
VREKIKKVAIPDRQLPKAREEDGCAKLLIPK